MTSRGCDVPNARSMAVAGPALHRSTRETCGPSVPSQSHSHPGAMSTPASKLPSVTDLVGTISTPPSRLPSGPLGLRTAAPHRRHTSPAVISFIAFTTRTVVTTAWSRDHAVGLGITVEKRRRPSPATSGYWLAAAPSADRRARPRSRGAGGSRRRYSSRWAMRYSAVWRPGRVLGSRAPTSDHGLVTTIGRWLERVAVVRSPAVGHVDHQPGTGVRAGQDKHTERQSGSDTNGHLGQSFL